MQRHFQILDITLTLDGSKEALAPLSYAYRRFVVPHPPSDGADVTIEVGADALTISGRRVPFVPGLDPQVQLQQQLQAALMDAIGSYAVLHAGALLDRDGNGFLLAAPSGHGKSSLTLEMIRRGYRFLSDDYAPLDLERRLVLPFPRAVAVKPEAASPIPERFRVESRAPGAMRLFGKALLDIGSIVGEAALAGEAAPLRHVLILSSTDTMGAPPRTTRVALAARPGDAALYDERFAATPGVALIERRETPHLIVWWLRLDHDENPTEELAGLFDRESTIFFEKQWDSNPDFTATAAATPVVRREAAALLGREMLNRRTGSALLRRYDGNVTSLFLDLASALTDAACWTVRVGEIGRTADLIERLLLDCSKVGKN